MASPFLMWFWLRQPEPVGSVAVSDFYMQDFNYSQWAQNQGKGHAYKNFTVTGKILHLKNKEFGPFTVAFLKEVVMDNPQIIFYKQGQHYAQLNAGQGLPDTGIRTDFIETATITFRQNPMLANIQGRVFTCDEMVWDKSKDTFRGEGSCQLQLGNEVVQAPVLIVDSNLNAWHVPGMIS